MIGLTYCALIPYSQKAMRFSRRLKTNYLYDINSLKVLIDIYISIEVSI